MFKYESDFISLGSTPNFKFNSVTASMRPEQEKLLLSASSTKDIKPLCRTINKFLEKSDPKYNKKDNSCKVHLNDY